MLRNRMETGRASAPGEGGRRTTAVAPGMWRPAASAWPKEEAHRLSGVQKGASAAADRPAYGIAKLLLEHAGSFLEREEAVQAAMDVGMPLAHIERYLEWLDLIAGD